MINAVQTDMSAFIAQLMALERQPLARIEAQKEDLDVRKKAFSDLDDKLSTLHNRAKDLAETLNSIFFRKTVTSSNESILTASAQAAALSATHSVHVDQLAKSHTMVSDQKTSTGTDVLTNLGAGTHSIDVTVNGVTTTVGVTLAAGDDNQTALTKLASAVNTAMADVVDPVTATVIQDSDGTHRLSIKSDETGTKFKMDIEDSGGPSLASYLGLNDESIASTATTGGYVYADSALDALLTVDGIGITSSTNVLEDVIPGVTLTLKSTQLSGDQDVTLGVEPDVEAVKQELDDFLDSYNAVMDEIRTKSVVDTELNVRGVFTGDSLVRGAKSGLSSRMVGAVTGLQAGAVQYLSEIGITRASDGKYEISDDAKLEDLLREDPQQVADLFNSSDGIGSRLESYVNEYVKVGGYLSDTERSIESKVDRLDLQTERFEAVLAQKEALYIRQFTELQSTLNQLGGQSAAIGGLTSSLFSSGLF